jgi:uncharacterized protein YaaR (DUF327 family)
LDEIKRFGFDDRPHMLFDSAGEREGYKSKEQQELNAVAAKNLDEVARVIKDLPPSQQAENLGIWSQMRGASEYNIYGQRSIEAIQGVKENEEMVVFDIEALGTPSHLRKDGSAGYFSPTEIAMQKGKWMNGDLQLGTSNSSKLSVLMKPNEETEKYLSNAIRQLRTNGWRGLDEDTARSLRDLSAYAGDPNKFFKKTSIGGKAYTNVLGHAPKVQGNASLALPEVLRKIEQGFANLKQYGTAGADAVEVLNHFLPNKRSTQNPVRMVGYNIYNYDELALKEAFQGNLAKNAQGNSKITKSLERLVTGVTNQKNIDLFHALKTTTPNPYGRFGTGMTLTDVHSAFGFKQEGTAHHGLTDVGYTGQIFGKVHAQVQKSQSVVSALNKKGTVAARNTVPTYWDKTPMVAGQTELFAFNGMPSYQAGKYDGIFKKVTTKGADGAEVETLEKMYGMKMNPVYARTMYKVDKFFQGVKLGDKSHYGVQLSTDDGTHHLLFRESKEELQKALHSHFMPIGKNGINPEAARTLQNEDRALRRYNNMFQIGDSVSSNGYNLMNRMYGHLDETQGMKWDAAEAHLRNKYGSESWLTDSYLRDLKTMAPRLRAEEGVWKPAMKEVAGQLGTNGERTIALHNFRDVLQQNVGTNKGVMATGGEAILPIKIGDNTNNLRGLDRNGMIRTIRSSVERGVKGNPKGMINQFNELIDNNLIPAFNNAGDKSMTKKMRAIQRNFHTEVMAGNKVSAIYEQVATMASQYMNIAHNSTQGMELERVSAVSATYASNLKGFKPESSLQKSIDDVAYFGKNLNTFLSTGNVADYLNQQKSFAQKYAEMSGLPNASLHNYNSSVFDNITKVDSKVKELAETYMRQGFRVQMFHSDKTGLAMGIMDKNAPESLARQGYHGLRASSDAAVIHLPGYSNDIGSIHWRNERHLNRFVGKVDASGKLSVGTTFDDVFHALKSNASRLKERYQTAQALGKKDFFINAESTSNRVVRNVLERSPMDYSKGYLSDDDLFHTRSAKANLNRSMYLDTSGMAEQWYREKYAQFTPDQRKLYGFDKTADAIVSGMEYGDSFINHAGYLAKARFSSEVDTWAEDKWGIETSSHGVNDRHMSKGYRSLVDPRRMTALGAFDKTSGENRNKALNYAPLDEVNVSNVLTAQGETDAMVRLRTQYGTTSPHEQMALQTEVNGVSMRAAYMDDMQIAASIATNRAKIDTELKKMVGSNEISMEDYQKYQKMLDNGQLTTYEGKAIMANKFKHVFDTTDDSRVRLGSDYVMDDKLKSALGDHAKKLGHTFDPNQSMYFGDHGGFMSVEDTQKLIGPDGKITVGSLMKDKDVRASYDAKANKEVFIKGWDADQQMLIIGKHNRGDEAMKTVTNTGRRHTETFMPQKVLDIVSGHDGTEAIIPHFSQSKGMDGARLEEKIRVYEDELLRQVHGISPRSAQVQDFITKNKVTVGALAKNGGMAVEGQAIREMLLPKLQQHLGLSADDVIESKGRVVFKDGFGFNSNLSDIKIEDGPKGNHVTAENGLNVNLGKMDEEMGGMLGTKFRKNGVEVGQVVKQRHDVWSDQYVSGAGGEGRVRVGLKELDAMRTHLNGVKGGADVVDFFKNEVHTMAKGGREAREAGQYIMNVMSNSYTPKAGDVVFDTSGLRPEIHKVNGTEINARMGEGGIIYVNPDSAKALPGTAITAKDMKPLADQYANTLLDSGGLQVNYLDEHGKVVSKTVNQHLKQGTKEFKGSAYLRLPDNSLGAEHMPLIDFQNIGRKKGDANYLNEIQRTQRNVIDNVNSYNTLGASGTASPEVLLQERNKLADGISNNVAKLRKQVNTYMSSGNEGSFLNQTANARLDMSGHFRAQGVNPFAQYSKVDGEWKNTGNIKENVAYLHKDDLLEMISGNEDNVLSAWGHDASKFSDTAAKQAHIIENVNKEGLFGPIIRYPIIDSSTTQTAKYQVADWVDRRSMYLGTGTVSRIAGDFDGDNFAGMLTNYKSKNARAYHSSLKEAYKKESVTSEFHGSEVMASLESDMRDSLSSQGHSKESIDGIMGALTQNKMNTVQDLVRAGYSHEVVADVMRAKTHAMDNTETVIARTGKEFIGHIDNARQRIQELHGITMDKLSAYAVKDGGVTAEYAARSKRVVNEVTRRLSQESIGSKKFTVQTLLQNPEYRTMTQDDLKAKAKELNVQRNDMLAKLRRDLYDPNMNVESTVQTLKDLGIHNEDRTTSLEIGIGRTNVLEKMNDTELFMEGLTAIRKTNRDNAHVGGFNAVSLKLSHSQGTQGVEELFANGTGFVPTAAVKEYQRMANSETQERMSRQEEAYTAGLLRQHQQNNDAEQLFKEMGSEGAKLEGRTILQDSFIEQKTSARFKDVVGEMLPKMKLGTPAAGSMAAGAVGFAAMWAATSLFKSAPTPEGMREQQATAAPAAPMDSLLTGPTARVTPNGEMINLQINAKHAGNMSHADVSRLVSQELQAQHGAQHNITTNVNDNSQNIDHKWVQDLVANAMNKGYGF